MFLYSFFLKNRFSVIKPHRFILPSVGLMLALATLWSPQDEASWLATHCRSSSPASVLSVDLKNVCAVITGLSRKKEKKPPAGLGLLMTRDCMKN